MGARAAVRLAAGAGVAGDATARARGGGAGTVRTAADAGARVDGQRVDGGLWDCPW